MSEKNITGDNFFISQEDMAKMEAAASGVNAYTLNLNKLGSQVELTFAKMISAMIPDDTVFAQIEEYGTNIQKTFGLSKERVDEFKNSIANVAPELVKMGFEEGEITDQITQTMEGLGTAASLSKEAIVEIAAAQKVTGIGAKDLASSFRDVGISIYDVGEQMKTVTEVARGAGVAVSAVAGLVTKNLREMNMYNFEGGVKGLARMAAQSQRLGIDMEKVFNQAEKLMNPEQAIDMSAALQRLGVTSSGLLDPLRAMDLAQNDPESLQKELVSLGKEFTRFNERTGQMEILPGAKRRMREVAEAVGMTGKEFAAMALKAGDFDMKLKQIKMPSLAEGDQETKELIASMAQLKDGVAQIEVRNKDTGVTSTKRVEELTPEDIENLKKANEESSKSIEEISLSQLDTTKRIENLLSSGIVGTKFATATTPTLSKFFGLVAESKLDMAKGVNQLVGSTENVRNASENFYQPLEKLLVAKTTGDEKGAALAQQEFGQNLFKQLGGFEEKFKTQIDATQNKLIENVKTAYSQPIKVEAKSDSNLNLNLNLKSDVNGVNFTPAEIDKIKLAMLNDPKFADDLKKVLNNNLVSASTGGKNQ